MKQRSSSLHVLIILSALMFGLLTIIPLTAGAIPPSGQSTNTPRQPHLFYQNGQGPFKTAQQIGFANNMTYHGGLVMGGTTHIFAIFWEPTGNVSATYNSLIQRYFGDIGGSSLYQVTNQYTDSNGDFPNNVVLASSFVDKRPFGNTTLQDSDVQNEVSHAQQVNGWSPSINNIFFVFTESGEVICAAANECSNNVFCAYHSNFGSSLYAAMPYEANMNGCNPGSRPNNSDADVAINVTSHEELEAATDPNGDAWFDANQAGEIGDKCNFQFGPLDAAGADVRFGNNNPYIVQKEWDNHSNSCRLTPSTAVPTPTPTPTPTPVTTTPTPTPTQTPTPTPGAQPWNGNFHVYAVGDLVTFQGHTYRCIQAHTSEPTWDPVSVPALWQLVS